MSANEISNKCHAMAILNLADVAPSAILVKGVGIAGVTRFATGVYLVTLLEPLDIGGGIVHVSHAAANSRIVVAQLQSLVSQGPDNLVINGFTDAGVAADTGEAYLSVWRFPSV